MTKDKYPASYLYTMITELLHEMDLSQYTVTDVCDFGYIPHSRGLAGRGMFVEVFTRDERGVISGSERHERLIEDDISYADWGNGGISGVVG